MPTASASCGSEMASAPSPNVRISAASEVRPWVGAVAEGVGHECRRDDAGAEHRQRHRLLERHPHRAEQRHDRERADARAPVHGLALGEALLSLGPDHEPHDQRDRDPHLDALEELRHAGERTVLDVPATRKQRAGLAGRTARSPRSPGAHASAAHRSAAPSCACSPAARSRWASRT